MSPYRSCIFCMWSAAHIYYGCAMLYAYIQMHTVHLPAYLPACVYLPPPYLRLHADMHTHTHTHVYVRTYDRQTERQTDPVIQTCVHTDICFEFTYMHVRTYVHGMHYTRVIYERIYTSALRASIHTHIHPYIHTSIHKYILAHTNTPSYMHACIRTYINTYICSNLNSLSTLVSSFRVLGHGGFSGVGGRGHQPLDAIFSGTSTEQRHVQLGSPPDDAACPRLQKEREC